MSRRRRCSVANPIVLAGVELAIAFAATRSPVASGSAQRLVTKALVGVLNTNAEALARVRTSRLRSRLSPVT